MTSDGPEPRRRRAPASVDVVRREIRAATSGRRRPTYATVRRRLRALLADGQADAVVTLGSELFARGTRHAKRAAGVGEIERQVSACLEVVLQALRASSLPRPAQLLWEIDARLRDRRDLLWHLRGNLDDAEAYTAADWSDVADVLDARLSAMPADGSDPGTPGTLSYVRSQVVREAVRALERSGREDEVIPLLAREVEQTRGWVEMLDRLLARDRLDEVLAWGRRGQAREAEENGWKAWQILERMRDAAARGRHDALLAALEVATFFFGPGEDRYAAVREACAPLGHWPAVRAHLLAWLETGVRPDRSPVPRVDPDGSTEPLPPWPLQDPGLVGAGRLGWPRGFPDHPLLIDVALQEGRGEDALALLRRWARRHERWAFHQRGEAVAKAVRDDHPDAALAIWEKLVVAAIARRNDEAYERAGELLWTMREVYVAEDRLDQWIDLVEELRHVHARKTLLKRELSNLEARHERELGA